MGKTERVIKLFYGVGNGFGVKIWREHFSHVLFGRGRGYFTIVSKLLI